MPLGPDSLCQGYSWGCPSPWRSLVRRWQLSRRTRPRAPAVALAPRLRAASKRISLRSMLSAPGTRGPSGAHPLEARPLGFCGTGMARSGGEWRCPSARAGGSALTGVELCGADSGWAVGAGSGRLHQPRSVLDDRVDGSRWARVSAPSPGGKAGTNLLAVATVSPSQAWATGGYDFGPESGRPLLMSWDGSSWTETLVNGLPRHGELYTVAAASSTDAWAAGYWGTVRSSLTSTARAGRSYPAGQSPA